MREARAPIFPMTRKHAGLLFLVAVAVILSGFPASAALPETTDPELDLVRTIRTMPFVGSSTSMRDHEGSAYVPGDDSLWLADDNGKAIYEVHPGTGALKRTIPRAIFNAAPQLGGGPVAGTDRTNDFESIAYDAANDQLYVFSGPCCSGSILPTAFRLVRVGGALEVESYQPLVSTADYTGAAWNPGDGKIYVGKGQQLRTYDYVANAQGPTFGVTGLSGITGMVFTSDGADLFVTMNQERLIRVRWSTKTLVSGWNFDLTPFDVLDSRGVELINDQFYVSDGADSRPAGDPLSRAVFVFDVTGPGPVAPTAAFSADPSSGTAPLTVNFTDTSTGGPTSWLWNFGDGSATSSVRHPTHVYSATGTFTVTLTVSNTAGNDSATRQIEVSDQPPDPGNFVANPGFEVDTSGWSTAGSGAGVTLTRVSPGRDGSSGAGRLANGSTGKRKCVLNDAPNSVTSTTAGTYTASIWVRGDGAGALVKINLREMNGSSVVRSRVKTFTLTTSWQQISVTHAALSPGSSLDLQVFLPRAYAPPGTCFYADDASVTRS